ncbi:hypothetical protein EDB92DRAFT_935755 [Lactarius akahatsu]|uniref:Uncharacterized protein n=1 Tax=Lactarius akahatsu TaxID=416441 RepID=A0AAD4LQI3_9AGAM|nr:hypothetical protein EDB92DRAFT_935755 [Lactarius akahatsu]
MTTHNPMYISAHSAEVILSDFRPLKLQPDALQFLNLLLDDILANIITSSRSILTDRLKSGLLKTLPTTMGKDALLEAEMELHAYWQRPNAIKPSASQTSTSEHSFAVPLMIELMRLKCEAYSTLNDSDEDAQVENKIQERLQLQGVEPPKSIVVAPASLYLTAILECICEHILSSVGRVATRDSSKEVAGTHDLFIALCEDDGIYPMFRVSKVYGLIEGSLKSSAKPRRSKSLSRSERHETRDTSLLDPPPQSQPRVSSESTTSGAVSGSVSPEYHPPRSSLDKGKAIKSFRSSGDRDMTLPSDPLFRVTLSKKSIIARDGKDGAAVETEEGNVIQDFDDLMRSGDTMKVSLTPDRLRSMEAAKQQQRRTAQQAPKTIVDDHHRASSASEADGRSPTPPDLKYHHPRKSLPHVDEDEELKETANLTQDVRSRSEVTKPPDTRARSVSTSKIYHSGPRVTRKSSLGIRSPPLQSGLPGRDMYDWRKNTPTTPQRTRKIQRNRESMDIEDVMNGSEGDESNPDQTAQGRGRLYPVSKATHDLISFLEDGPPPEVQPVRSATVSSTSLAPTTKSAKSGSRLQRMISKFSIAREGFQESARGRGVGITSAPSTPVSSLRSLGASNPPPPPIAVKPVPPPIPQLPISPPSSSRTSSLEDDARPHISRTDRPRKMSVRKAVPTWESAADQGLQTPHTGAERILPPSPPLSSQPVSASSPSPFQPHGHVRSSPTLAPEGKDTNGDTHNHKAVRSESPAAIPAGTEAHLTRENGNGRAEQQYPQGIYRPRSSRPNLRSPSNDEQSHSARKSLGRRSQPPNGTVDSQLIHPSPSLSEALAVDMRRLMSQATSADECRLLVDTFLTRAGIVPPPPVSVVADITPPDVELLEHTLVNYFLGADLEGLQLPQTQSLQAEVKRRSTSSTPKQAQESDDAHLSTASLMDSAHAVYTHHIVSDAVAVVS